MGPGPCILYIPYLIFVPEITKSLKLSPSFYIHQNSSFVPCSYQISNPNMNRSVPVSKTEHKMVRFANDYRSGLRALHLKYNKPHVRSSYQKSTKTRPYFLHSPNPLFCPLLYSDRTPLMTSRRKSTRGSGPCILCIPNLDFVVIFFSRWRVTHFFFETVVEPDYVLYYYRKLMLLIQ